MSVLTRMLQRLTDAYTKDPDSNVGKLLRLGADEIQEVRDALNKTKNYRDIDQATGHTLDRIGLNVQQYRGKADDPVYRTLIKSKVRRMISDGTRDAIASLLVFLLDVEKSEITIEALWPEEAAAMGIEVPTEAVNEAGMTLHQFGRLLNAMTAAGVRATTFFEGTFQFSSQVSASEYEPDEGFYNAVTGTGGYFGAVYDPAEDVILPM